MPDRMGMRTAIAALVLTLAGAAWFGQPLTADENSERDGNGDAAGTARAPAIDERVAQWIAQLGNEDHAERVRAERRLRQLGPDVVPDLRAALRQHRDAEIVFRLQALLTELDDNLFMLCALLRDHDSRVRRYAEEALVVRFLDTSRTVPQVDAWGRPVRRPVLRLAAVRLELPAEFEASAYDVLAIVRRAVPLVASADVYEMPGFLTDRRQWRGRSLSNVELALRELTQNADVRWRLVPVGHDRHAIVVDRPGPEPHPDELERHLALTLCRLLTYDMDAARRDAFTELGRLFADRPSVQSMLATEMARRDNPWARDLVRAVVLAPTAPPSLLANAPQVVPYIADLLGNDESWPVRQAAARALVQRANRAAGESAGEGRGGPAAAERVFAALESALHADDAVERYVALWAAGALREAWLRTAEAQAEDAEARESGVELPAPWLAGLRAALGAEPDLARQALQALTHLRLSDADVWMRAFERGLDTQDDDLREAALAYASALATTRLYEAALERYADARSPQRTFIARLLGSARDPEILTRLLELLLTETQSSIGRHLLAAYTEAYTDESAWPTLERMLRSDELEVRRSAREIVVRSGLPNRRERLRAVLQQAENDLTEAEPALVALREQLQQIREELRAMRDDAANDAAVRERRPELERSQREVRGEEFRAEARVDLLRTERAQIHVMLLRLGEVERIVSVRTAIVDAERLNEARAAAIGLGEMRHDEAQSIFEQAFGTEREANQLAALHGFDALARAYADAGDQAATRTIFSRLSALRNVQSVAVQQLLHTVRNRFWSSNGYNALAQQNAQRTANNRAPEYPAEAPEPRGLLSSGRQ